MAVDMSRLAAIGAVLVFLGIWLGHAPAGEQAEDEARKSVRAYIGKFKGAERGQFIELPADWGRAFGSWRFFVLRFRLYPVAFAPPGPLRSNNLFAVRDGKVIPIRDETELATFFKENVPVDADAAEATRTWLRFAEELHKDGFIEFEQPEVKTEGSTSEGTVRVVAKRGDRGELRVRMEFQGGKLMRITPGGNIRSGIRPICQATKLLDPDPLVREIMRRDILVMGRACGPYLEEVRARASPELQRAIDQVWQQILADEP